MTETEIMLRCIELAIEADRGQGQARKLAREFRAMLPGGAVNGTKVLPEAVPVEKRKRIGLVTRSGRVKK